MDLNTELRPDELATANHRLTKWLWCVTAWLVIGNQGVFNRRSMDWAALKIPWGEIPVRVRSPLRSVAAGTGAQEFRPPLFPPHVTLPVPLISIGKGCHP